MIGRVTGAAAAAVGTAFASALCCAGPLVAVTLGMSGAGLASTFEPLRPYFLAGSGLFLVAGHLGLRSQKPRRVRRPNPLRCTSHAPTHEVHALVRHRTGDRIRDLPDVVGMGAVNLKSGDSRCFP